MPQTGSITKLSCWRASAAGLATLAVGANAFAEAGVEANACWSMHQVPPCSKAGTAIEEKRAILVGAVYDLETGGVRVLEE